MTTKIEQLKQKFDDLKNEMKAQGKEALFEAFRQLFAENPQIVEIQWTQYTPYFNDGDVCSFSRHDMAFYLDSDEDLEDDSPYDHTVWYIKQKNPTLAQKLGGRDLSPDVWGSRSGDGYS
jgi:hypothetical protein